MNKKLKYLLIGFVLSTLVGFIGVHYIAPYGILKPLKRHANYGPEQFCLVSEDLAIKTDEAFHLSGYWFESKLDTTKGVMILVHGIGNNKEHFLGLADELAHQGIESILFDGRSHGKSGGDFCTYGYYEKRDVSNIVDLIKARNPNMKIGIWGHSLGGAIALQALELDHRIEFGIIESTFTDLSQIVYDYKKRILQGLGIRSLSNYALWRASKIAGFEAEKVRPIDSVKNIEQPVFISHGDADRNISPKYGQELFENLKSECKEFMLIEGVGHAGLLGTNGQEYKGQVLSFINENIAL